MKKIAYLILAHDDPYHLQRLVQSINYQCDFFIHIDKKKDQKEFESLIRGGNVYFCDERFDISWGGFNMVLATKALMKQCLNHTKEYTHLILLSGSDYPIKNKKVIFNYFQQHEGVEFIRAYKIKDSQCLHCLDKIKTYHFYDRILKQDIVNKILKKGLTLIMTPFKKQVVIKQGDKVYDPCFGSQWVALTPQCVEYILSDDFSKIDYYFKTSFAPDEMYFHTIIFNSSFSVDTVNHGIEPYQIDWQWNNYHFINTEELRCTTVKKINLKEDFQSFLSKKKYEGSLGYLTEESIDEIKESPFLFVRKVNSKYSSKLLNLVDELIQD